MISKIAKIFVIAFVIIGIIVVAIVFALIPIRSDKKIDTNESNNSKIITKEDFDFSYKYIGNNSFEYEIKGNLPTPCYKTMVEAIVRESFPEQVVVQLSISEPDPDTACLQVIQEFEYKNIVNASENASFEFNVKYGQ